MGATRWCARARPAWMPSSGPSKTAWSRHGCAGSCRAMPGCWTAQTSSPALRTPNAAWRPSSVRPNASLRPGPCQTRWPDRSRAVGHCADGRLPGAASYSHWRPAAVLRGRRLGRGAMFAAGPGYSIPARRAWFAIAQSPIRRRHRLVPAGPATTAPAGPPSDNWAQARESNREPHHLDRRPHRHHPVHRGLLRPALNPRRVKPERFEPGTRRPARQPSSGPLALAGAVARGGVGA